MNTLIEDRIIAALDQMARAAIPDESTADLPAGVPSDRTRLLVEPHRVAGQREPLVSSRRALAFAASVLLICIGVVAIAARLDDSGKATITDMPSALTIPVSIPSDQAAPFVAIVDPEVAGAAPARDNHLVDWVNGGNETMLYHAYRATPGGGFDVVSWQGFTDILWNGEGKDYPADAHLNGIAGLDARRQNSGDGTTRFALMRSSGSAHPDGIHVTMPESQEGALRGWLESAAGDTATNGMMTAKSLAAPEGYTLLDQLGPPVEVAYFAPTAKSEPAHRSMIVRTWTFTSAVDLKAWCATGQSCSFGAKLNVRSGTAWWVNTGDPSRTSVLWQPNDRMVVTLETDEDVGFLANGLMLVPRDSYLLVETNALLGPPAVNQSPKQSPIDEIRASTPIGRFGYQVTEINGEVCETLAYSDGASGRCDDAPLAGQTANAPMCVVANIWSNSGGARVYAFVDAADAGSIEIRRDANDRDPVVPQIFSGESNGQPWALVFAEFDDPSGVLDPDVQFVGGRCQPDAMTGATTSTDPSTGSR